MQQPSILIDGNLLLEKRGTGIASYTRTLAKCLHSVGAEVNLLFHTNSRPQKGAPAYTLATQVFCHRPPVGGRLALLASFIRNRCGLKRTVDSFEVPLDDIDLTAFAPPLPPFHRIFNATDTLACFRAASLWGARMVTVLPRKKFAASHWAGPTPIKMSTGPNLYTIHDMIPIQFPYFVIDKAGFSARLHETIAQVADHIITVSETSKSNIVDILKIAPERVSVTYQAAPAVHRLPQEEAERLVSSLYRVQPKSYALFLGAIEPKKNVSRLIEAFLASGVDIRLLLAGSFGWLYDDEEILLNIIERRSQSLLEKYILTQEKFQYENVPIKHLGYLPRRHVTALLQCAKFFVFPSIYEGFGLPCLEAMQLQVPVLTSRTGSICEVVGEAALLVDPLDIDDIARGIRQLDADDDLRAELARRGPIQAAKFSDEAYAKRLREAYAKVGVFFPNVNKAAADRSPRNMPLNH